MLLAWLLVLKECLVLLVVLDGILFQGDVVSDKLDVNISWLFGAQEKQCIRTAPLTSFLAELGSKSSMGHLSLVILVFLKWIHFIDPSILLSTSLSFYLSVSPTHLWIIPFYLPISPIKCFLISCLLYSPLSSLLADVISTVEFNQTGELLATGGKGGRVVIFQRESEVSPLHPFIPLYTLWLNV